MPCNQGIRAVQGGAWWSNTLKKLADTPCTTPKIAPESPAELRLMGAAIAEVGFLSLSDPPSGNATRPAFRQRHPTRLPATPPTRLPATPPEKTTHA